MNTDLKNEKRSQFWVSIKLIEDLFAADGMQRHRARLQLEKEGRQVTPLLIGALKSNNTDVRWEATKALIKIKDPLAADALTDALMDEDYEVRWLAGEALIALSEKAVKPILRKLLSHYDSSFLRTGAHHVIEFLKNDKSLDKEVLEVLDELGAILPLEPYPLAAKNALDILLSREKNSSKSNQKATEAES